LKVVASGGVSTLNDLRSIRAMESLGVDAVIMGKALYSGAIDLREALAVADGEEVG
jgi:phosphoribosylformimino-5-aminoimidazole carboxamide ribotide isomerase